MCCDTRESTGILILETLIGDFRLYFSPEAIFYFGSQWLAVAFLIGEFRGFGLSDCLF